MGLIQSGKRARVNTYTTTAHTLVAADAYAYVEMNNAAANTVTIPPESEVPFAIGTMVNITQAGAGTTSVAAGTGVTIVTAGSLDASAQYASLGFVKIASDIWQQALA